MTLQFGAVRLTVSVEAGWKHEAERADRKQSEDETKAQKRNKSAWVEANVWHGDLRKNGCILLTAGRVKQLIPV